MHRRLSFGALLALGALSAGCFDVFSDPEIFHHGGVDEDGTSGTGGTGGTTTTVTPGCIPVQVDGAIDDACGVFVSAANGKDTNTGTTKAAPLATLGKAIVIAKGKPIYACADEAKPFVEAVTIDGDAIVYGGLDCASWKYVETSKTRWTAGADERPLELAGGATLAIADVNIEAADATKDGGSSIAIVAQVGASLELARCEVIAGKGMTGVTPTVPAGMGTVGMPGGTGLDGCIDMVTKSGADGGQLTCDAQSVSGGSGGNGTKTDAGGDGSDGNPADVTAGLGGKAQKESPATACATGGDGAAGLSGDPGAGATGKASLTASGYQGESGADGATVGKPGQGGGGGGGAKRCGVMPNFLAGPSAGGGGSGGCGGAVGKGGGPGGASIAIVSRGATFSFTTVTITTNSGGNGGDGGLGQPGGDGGDGGQPGTGDATSIACAGGKGGKGGPGGRGGGGLGGPSIGIAYTGTKPDDGGATFNLGAPGTGGLGDGATGMGATGVAADTQGF